MTSTAADLYAAQLSSQLLSVRDALYQSTLPHLDLKQNLLLGSTCTAWLQLITRMPLHQLSERARRALVPSELAADGRLLELIEQQAQLLNRLRGKQGFHPSIQRLRCFHPSNSQHASAGQDKSRRRKTLQYDELAWSPCTSLEQSSRWLALNPAFHCKCSPTVVDSASSHQMSFKGESSVDITKPAVFQPDPQIHASWLGNADRLLLHPSSQAGIECQPGSISLADMRGQTISRVNLPGADHSGRPCFFTVSCKDGLERDIVCWVAKQRVNGCLKDHIRVYDLSTCLPLYQLGCPETFAITFLDTHSANINPVQRSRKPRNWCLLPKQVLLDHSRQYLAVVWESWLQKRHGQAPKAGSHVQGLSIHAAMSGELQHSMLLTVKGFELDWASQFTWLPHSSHFCVCVE